MCIHDVLTIVMILIGVGILSFSIIKTARLFELLALIDKKKQRFNKLFFKFHMALMIFFNIAYIFVAIAYWFNFTCINNMLIGAVFMFGAVFVLIDTYLKTEMLSGMANTMYSLAPICSNCKKVRYIKDKPEEQKSWIPIELYLLKQSTIKLSHGLCPECLKKLYPDL